MFTSPEQMDLSSSKRLWFERRTTVFAKNTPYPEGLAPVEAEKLHWLKLITAPDESVMVVLANSIPCLKDEFILVFTTVHTPPSRIVIGAT